jgi:hypothetical protein
VSTSIPRSQIREAHLWSTQVLFAVEVHDEHVCWLHELLLHAAGRDVDLVFMSDACASSCTCDLRAWRGQHSCRGRCIHSPQIGGSYPSQGVEVRAERADVVCGVVWVVGVNERFRVLRIGCHLRIVVESVQNFLEMTRCRCDFLKPHARRGVGLVRHPCIVTCEISREYGLFDLLAIATLISQKRVWVSYAPLTVPLLPPRRRRHHSFS